MKKIFLVFVLLLLIGFISGCNKQDTPTPPTTPTETSVDTGLDDIEGEINDVDTATGSDYNIDDIDLENDMPDI